MAFRGGQFWLGQVTWRSVAFRLAVRACLAFWRSKLACTYTHRRRYHRLPYRCRRRPRLRHHSLLRLHHHSLLRFHHHSLLRLCHSLRRLCRCPPRRSVRSGRTGSHGEKLRMLLRVALSASMPPIRSKGLTTLPMRKSPRRQEGPAVPRPWRWRVRRSIGGFQTSIGPGCPTSGCAAIAGSTASMSSKGAVARRRRRPTAASAGTSTVVHSSMTNL